MTTIEASMEAVIEDMVTITEDTKEAMIVEEDIKEEAMIVEEDTKEAMITEEDIKEEAMTVEEDIKEEMITEEDMVEMIEVTQVIVVIYLTEVAVYSVLLLL